ncbi:UNVERIFIED_CONTAM: Phospholipase SGR2 [Sesamum radiatum]|uniref:Phospholipase SGR2 n=1 Tax=Sesamum radiatum TaxID=300843 RepID=A0AAW2UM42_SESRA
MPSDMAASGAEGVEETSPDMLKNTPSNIRRLVNEIEQYESRQKYLAHTRSPSDGGDVRWYFCKVPLAVNELAASVPRTEIVGKGDYFRFGMRDSLAIEASFLQREDELLSSWWKEYAECSEGPRGKLPSSKTSLKSSEIPESLQLFTAEEERVGVPVKGGLYEVDLVKRHCFPVYWNGENRRVVRGHWFARKGGLDWLPLREDVSEQLEYAYRSQSPKTKLKLGFFSFRCGIDEPFNHQGLHALFTGEDDTWEAWLSVDSGFSSVVGFGRNNSKLRRGYAPSQSQKPTKMRLLEGLGWTLLGILPDLSHKFFSWAELNQVDYGSVPVRHLVFMVHGIGQRLEKSNLVDDVGDFRHVTASLAERHLTSHQRGTQRVLYIPCQIDLLKAKIKEFEAEYADRGKGKEYWEEENINEEMPACRQMFNIFHPFDPVAYRIEPLVSKEFVHKRPVIVPYHRGGKRLYVGFQEFKEGLASRSHAFVDQMNTVRDKTFRHPYLSAIGSHTNYWRDYDTALFILKHLYRDIPDGPISHDEQPESSSKDENSYKQWSDPREIEDEELPLTFANSVSIKNFSHRAKKTMK